MPLPIIIATIMRPVGDTGVQTHFRAFAEWLLLQRYQYATLTPYNSPKWLVYPIFGLRKLIEPISGMLSVWWYRHWHMYFLRAALRTALRKLGPCVIYAQCPLSASAALQVRHAEDQHVVMVVHFNISQANEWAEKGKIHFNSRLFKSIHRFEACLLPKLDGLVYVSDFMRREISERIPAVQKVPYRVIPNFLANPAPRESSLNTVADLICIGTLEPRKNQAYAIEIIAAAQILGQHLRLTIVGDGPDHNMLVALADRLGVADAVHFKGYVEQAETLMANHRAYLHVARMESFGITLIEAMAAGIPVFAPYVGGIPEVFDDGIEGLRIPLDDAPTAAKLIISWINDPVILCKARHSARKRFLSHFESNGVASKLALFLHQIHQH